MRPGDDVDAVGAGGVGRVAGLGGDDDRVLRGTARPPVTLANLLRELAVGQVQRALADEAEGGASQKAVVPPLPSATS